MIMSDAAIEFKTELFYGDVVTTFVCASGFTRIGFDLYYKMMRGEKVVVIAKTGMICYDYDSKKVVSLPDKVQRKMSTTVM